VSDRVGAVLVAAGASSRMGFDKVWAELNGRPLLSYALEVLAGLVAIERVALVVAEARRPDAAALVKAADSRIVVCAGGALRRESVAAGRAALAGPRPGRS
jgi:2-C-methyl-D-erythritol 4-phosphate cytidylyltransferase